MAAVSLLTMGWIDSPNLFGASPSDSAPPPNVILIVTDDQGFGDLGAHGNPHIRTPHLDQLQSESVHLSNFHVDPVCAPTRAALMTGRFSVRAGVWNTIMGRSLLAPQEVTLGEIFRSNGYRTALFGKWHLGDNYPLRPEDQGFDEVVRHGGGGVGQTADYWGNNYIDDTYWSNGTPTRFEGHCTGVWFREALQFIDNNRSRPFFLCIAPNAPHPPLHAPTKYWLPYREEGLPLAVSCFYGLISQIDENIGLLRKRLAELKLDRNTLLIFTTDNGSIFTGDSKGHAATGEAASAADFTGYDGGMRGGKSDLYEGGHRVPCFLHWPEGGLTGGRDVRFQSAHIDLFPTLVQLCQLRLPREIDLDGLSLVPWLRGEDRPFPERTLFLLAQFVDVPVKDRGFCVLTERWRLLNTPNGRLLFDIQADPRQQQNLFQDHPGVAEDLSRRYDNWWESIKRALEEPVRIPIGSSEADPVRLTAQDWHGPWQDFPWNQEHVLSGAPGNGWWALDVARTGRYRIELYRWPEHLDKEMNRVDARIALGSIEQSQPLEVEQTYAAFTVNLESGPTQLQTWLSRPDGQTHGAYFVHVSYEDSASPAKSSD